MSRQHILYQISQSLSQIIEKHEAIAVGLFRMADSDSFEEFQEYIEDTEIETGDLSLDDMKAIYDECKNIQVPESEEKILELQGGFSDSLSYLLCGNQYGALDFIVTEEGLVKINALFGMREIKGDILFDSAFYISPSEAKTIAKALSSISEDEFERREKWRCIIKYEFKK